MDIPWHIFYLHPVFMSSFFAWLLAQIIKLALDVSRVRKISSWKEVSKQLVWRTGGMPSSHCAAVFALTTMVGLLEGPSNLFMLSLGWGLVVMRDAVGVRQATGNQAQILNNLARELKNDSRFSDLEELKEIRGHTLKEALAGILLGGVSAYTFYYFLKLG